MTVMAPCLLKLQTHKAHAAGLSGIATERLFNMRPTKTLWRPDTAVSCLQTCLKMLYWSKLMYAYEEVRHCCGPTDLNESPQRPHPTSPNILVIMKDGFHLTGQRFGPQVGDCNVTVRFEEV